MKKGFTLIELMIVVAIIGIPAAIAIPKFHQLLTGSHIKSKYADMIKATPYNKDSLIKQRDLELANFNKTLAEKQGESWLDYSTYKLQDGTIIECQMRSGTGPSSFYGCKDGKEYLSQINVVKLK